MEENIIVKDRGKLVVRNAEVIINNTYKSEYWVDVTNRGTLVIEDSVLKDRYAEFYGSPELALRVRGSHGRLIMKNTKSDWWIQSEGAGTSIFIDSSSIFFLSWYIDGDVHISNSEITKNIRMSLKGKKYEVLEFHGLKPGMIESFSLRTREGGFLKLENTKVGTGWIIDAFHERDPTNKRLVFEDSHFYEFYLTFPRGSKVKISKLKPGFFSSWRLRDAVKGLGRGYNITLINSQVDSWKPRFYTGKGEIENSHIGCIDTRENATLIVKNSHIDFYHSRGARYVKFVDSSIGTIRLIYDTGVNVRRRYTTTLEFENSFIGAGLIEIAADAIIKGSVSFPRARSINWQAGTVNREYVVVVKDLRGRAVFDINFTKENYDKKWKITAMINKTSVSTEIGFLSNTPIMLSLPSLEKSRKETKSEISEVEYRISWAEELGKISGLDTAKQVVREAEAEYNQGNFARASLLAEQAMELVAIKIDGDSDDWKGVKPLATDPERDAKTPETDMKALYALVDKDYLYLMIEFYSPEPERRNYLVKFNMGKGEKYQVDTMPPSIWDTSLDEKLGGCEVGINNVIEIKVPLEKLDYPGKIFITAVHCWDNEKRVMYDELDELGVVETLGEITTSY
ncbi:hypothetical protein ES703_19242 [subsurface metagenome]